MNVVKTSPRREVTYLGRRAIVWTEYATNNRLGERIDYTEWVDQADERNGSWAPGTIRARHCKGDGRLPSFVVYRDWTVR